jgi:hypothetical protein
MDPVPIDISTEHPDEIRNILDSFGQEYRVDPDTPSLVIAQFDTVLHSLAFAEAAEGVRWASVGRPPLDEDGWERWTDAGRDQREVGAPLLPAQFDSSARVVFRYDYAWVHDANGEPNTRLARELGIRSLATGSGQVLWKAVKFAYGHVGEVWKVTKSWQFFVAQTALGFGWREIRREAIREQLYLEPLQAQRLAALALSQLRNERLNSGSSRQRQKWGQHYAELDALIEANR